MWLAHVHSRENVSLKHNSTRGCSVSAMGCRMDEEDAGGRQLEEERKCGKAASEGAAKNLKIEHCSILEVRG